jgi:5S rRNA maturation endonuclease (ribonuclease M5)
MNNREEIKEINQKLAKFARFILPELGIHDNEYSEDTVRSHCPVHNGDNPTAFAYWYSTGTWVCFSAGCHTIQGNDLLGLIKGVKQFSFDDSVKFALELLGKTEQNSEITTEEVIEPISKKKFNFWNEHLAQYAFHESTIKKLRSPWAYCQQRGFDYYLVKSYDCGIGSYGRLENRFIVPIRNIEDKIVGFSGRDTAWTKEKGAGKWQYNKGFQKSLNLFNIHKAAKIVKEWANPWIILVEGPFDVFKAEQAGIHNSVAVLGDAINSGQIEVLKKCNVIDIVIAFDPDKPGKKAAEKTKRKLDKELFSVSLLEWEKEEDWGDKNVTTQDIVEAVNKTRS